MLSYSEEHFSTADGSLEALLPTRNSWGERLTGWAFRGHQEASWGLVPTAFRDGTRLGPIVSGQRATNEWQRVNEARLLGVFARFCDSQGLPLPGESVGLRERWLKPHSKQVLPMEGVYAQAFGPPDAPENWPDSEVLPLLGLARHYGVPTRLLDWSRNPLVGAYFATVSAAERYVDHGADGRLAVWGLKTSVLHLLRGEVEMLSMPYASNPNLRLQEGLFTLIRERDWKPEAELDRRGLEERLFESSNIEAIVEELSGTRDCKGSFLMRKLTLPQSEAPALLDHLNCLRISAATIYAGYEGPAKAIDETRYRQYWIDAQKEISERETVNRD